jgi:hypothetical protein
MLLPSFSSNVERQLGRSVGKLTVATPLHDDEDADDIEDAWGEARCTFTNYCEKNEVSNSNKKLRSDVRFECVCSRLEGLI